MILSHGLRTFLFSIFGAFSICAYSQFGPDNIVASANDPTAVITSDLDNDGDEDIVVSFSQPGTILWYENLGFGNFSKSKIIYETINFGGDLYSTDIDGDGDNDIVASTLTDAKVIWFENFGDGLFSTEKLIYANQSPAYSIQAADLDGDGDQDLIAGIKFLDRIEVYQNLGNGLFSIELIASGQIDVISVFTQDLDNDGDEDILCANEQYGEIVWFENTGDMEFSSENVLSISEEGASAVFSADLDGDGDFDVLSASSQNDEIAWFENLGSGEFSPALVITNTAINAQSVFAIDLDGDGDEDVMSASYDEGEISWYRNMGGGVFSEEIILSNEAVGAIAVIAADLDNDGHNDLLTVSEYDAKVAWYKNSGNAFAFVENVLSASVASPHDVQVIDLDGDGQNDLVSTSYTRDRVYWHKNIGDDGFTYPMELFSTGDGPVSIQVVDLDSDGDFDILTASQLDNKIMWAENLGNENFADPITITDMADNPRDVFAADMDGDGDVDVISASWDDNKVAWYENQGLGTFSSFHVISTTTTGARAIYAIDLDGDGDQDIQVAGSESIGWFENLGNGNFSTEKFLGAVGSGNSVFSIDFNGDGNIDVLAADGSQGKAIWFMNLGNGDFSAELLIGEAAYPLSIIAADFDNDGDMDVVTANQWATPITRFENLGNEVFSSQIDVSTQGSGKSVTVGDIDGDGDFDIVSSTLSDSRILWNENMHGNGCMIVGACNYDSTAIVEDNSCCFGVCGCTDPESTSYDSLADCNDGSCTYRLDGWVFYDENEDGVWDNEEYGLPFQEVTIQPMGWTTFTNDAGFFSFIGPGLGEYTAEIIPGDAFPFVTTTNPLEFEVIWDFPTTEIQFGVSDELPLFAICVDFYPPGFGYQCNDWVNHNICYRNEGNVPIDGIVEVEYDLLFQDFQEGTPIDSVVGHKIYMSFENLLPGQMFFYNVALLSPTVDFIGEILTSTARVYGIYEENQVAYGEKELNVEMTCAYDPNDKQVFPNGHLEEHLILNETELEYLIRFQNTGNAPATNVLVTDTIDENLNLETFALVANSHSVQTTIKPDERVIQFLFENIMLPDSTANEPESHGLISFKITPYPNLEPGTVLNNTGNIFFDNNPPIITNTTWNTIHECGGEAEHTLISGLQCEGHMLEITSDYPWIDSLTLILNEEVIDSGESIMLQINDIGIYEYTLVAVNPLCEESTTIIHLVNALPPDPPCFADFNCDGQRNIIDLLDFLPEFGCLSDCEMDLDSDGIISVFDLSIFLGLVGNDCEE